MIDGMAIWLRTWKNKTGRLEIEGLGESYIYVPLRTGTKYDNMVSYMNSLQRVSIVEEALSSLEKIMWWVTQNNQIIYTMGIRLFT